MQKNINYQIKLEEMIQNLKLETEKTGVVKTLLLHSCCAPCSSYVLEYLSQYFRITIFYYNPNISNEKEYAKRVEEQKRLIAELPVKYKVSFIEGDYCTSEFEKAIEGLEHLGERSKRCYECYKLRLTRTAEVAQKLGFDYFTTTLSISPYKNAGWLNEIGEQLMEQLNIPYVYADFKKNNGYKRSIELSQEYHLYRQEFCGCSYSKAEEEHRKQQRKDLAQNS